MRGFEAVRACRPRMCSLFKKTSARMQNAVDEENKKSFSRSGCFLNESEEITGWWK